MLKVREIFSSIQGEGIYVGRRQIFVRFAKCNLDCDYCDTAHKREGKFCIVNGKRKILKNADDIADEIKNLYTKDIFSISLTGGEPLIYTSLIRQIHKRTDIPLYLETNSTLPEKAYEIKNLITYAACGIKINYPKFYNDSLKTIEILSGKNLFVKVVITKDVDTGQIGRLAKNIKNIADPPFVLQPQTGIKWDKIYKNNLLEMSETAGNYLSDVRVIPQLHKFLGFE
ncbi:MAG: 7-carboxy-7-deazaguanine synthase QueE [Candidatus Altiarchaeum hamiconexum]|uniref:7-carboxy-7-deazaguanine synthase n=1 Tax=Candidatus Altarchaeum hamiconexum TaxID=1803513 RepID=A0A8J8CHD9_9ARCH|nr:7-carboxy-7-deazaguanine synthase QueE [Candidatus Altarchaeum hamiconexum]OIQ04937.1 MAG: hypothetical protein AUK59_05740 [Candidatus Altarchaeum sp. CG2_30_32_3053]PIN67105.1 MAG: radical SAM protein [Candidatus Altarchaeum sp. CG12_big_fil_rev_8_21_14_0_65_33_22]PIV27059.1 MAG: radical SAM protein [Candidatus Altarchaeum sp. CG03_land_8_20_14_0_80_32_618]PJC14731.1 MAG: radical SAM protein [Candidatus Altarchaeum sp. CG_4_9_14_0_8_um_filter_32_206]